MNLNHNTNKQTGDKLTAAEWNKLAEDVNELGNNESGSTPGTIDTNGVVTVNSKGNTTISSAKHINIEPAYVANGGTGTYGDIQIKPGDDITLESHHRATDKRDEITIKTSNGKDKNDPDKATVKLQIKAADITLSSDGKKVASGSNDSNNVMNVRVTSGNGKGYLKVRAQAIDLRCEDHGGIALQPKGRDRDGNMNKIKFEHGGGDGLEFGTFNAEKTSIFTDEYRFNKDGVWKMASRSTRMSDKYDVDDDTTDWKYLKNDEENNESLSLETGKTFEPADDFYDFIDVTDPVTTTKDIIKTVAALSGTGVKTHTSNKGNLEIQTTERYISISTSEAADYTLSGPYTLIDSIAQTTILGAVANVGTNISRDDLLSAFPTESLAEATAALDNLENGETIVITFQFDPHSLGSYTPVTAQFKKVAKDINIESCSKLKLKGILDFGSSFNFGETDNGIEFLYKLTKKNAEKDCGILKVVGINNHETNSLTVEGTTIAPGQTATIAQCSILDLIKLVDYFKTGAGQQNGPWASQS